MRQLWLQSARGLRPGPEHSRVCGLRAAPATPRPPRAPRDRACASPVLTSVACSFQVQAKKEEPRPPASSQSIPAFYFPRGRPQGAGHVEAAIAAVEKTFAQFPHERATMEDMGRVARVRALRGARVPRSRQSEPPVRARPRPCVPRAEGCWGGGRASHAGLRRGAVDAAQPVSASADPAWRPGP